LSSFCRGFGPARFDYDDGLTLRNIPRCSKEAAGVPNRLHIDYDRLRVKIFAKILDQIAPTDIEHGTDGNKCAKPEHLPQAPIEYRCAERPALTDKCHASGQSILARERSIHASDRIHE